MGEKTAGNLFPYKEMREVQAEMVKEVEFCLNKGVHLIAHAPTGLGKTSAVLAPAMRYALDHNKTIFFLTSRHTQHNIAVETLREMKTAHDIPVPVVDLIGKQHMCSVPGVSLLYGNEFFEFCKKQREEGKCDFYLKTRKSNKLTTEAKLAVKVLEEQSPLHIEKFKELCANDNLCSYEIATTMAAKAKVIIADYYYIFSPSISSAFLKKADLQLSDAIVVVDEAHNLPERIRNLLTTQLSSFTLQRAIKEAEKAEQDDIFGYLNEVKTVLESLSIGIDAGEERIVKKDDFISKMKSIKDYDALIEELKGAAESVRESEKQSFISSIADFLESWKGPDDAYVRFISKKRSKNKTIINLIYRCLDPSILTHDVISQCHSVIMMSGTLQPTAMYRDLLGFPEKTMERTYESPFPEENRLSMIIPETTTKYNLRNEDQFRRIGEICAEVTNEVPGNCALFFPSYYLRDKVHAYFEELSEKTSFVEQGDMTKEEKAEFLDKFKSYNKTGAVLLGAITGSYGEGIDLPGDFLNCVVVVGLPLQKPNLEVSALIDYYDKKFGKGWDYGYVYPAFQKTLQSAGRCIRSESDRGVIIFLDERYTWSRYFKNFPKDWRIIVTRQFTEKIRGFFHK
ncbi:MAG: ATP-dependent DNA helicase [Nanoarchaeota archaeon]|nr:ATP-dependent DNA helicase [Nanoarchaeota archaeon]